MPSPPLTPSSPPATDRFELFGFEQCDKRLPVNEVVEEYSFGQFVRIRYNVADGDSRPIVAMVPPVSQRSALSAAGGAALGRGVSVKGLLSGSPERLAEPEASSELRRVEIDDVDHVIAEGMLKIERETVRVGLDASQIRGLLAGLAVEASVHMSGSESRVLLTPRACRASLPISRHYLVNDLATFLENPVVPGVGGNPYPLVLDASAVKELRRDGVAQVGDGAEQVVLTRMSSGLRADPNASSSRTRGVQEVVRLDHPGPPLMQSRDAFTLGLYLPWIQSWRLKGYSRGSLLHSLTLAPQEEATIELFTWDRRKRSLDQSSSFDTEQSIEQSETTKDVIDVVRELANSNEFKIEGHARVNVKYAAVEADVGIAGDYTSKLNETAKRSTQHLVDSTTKAAARVRASRQTKISESSEIGREERVTRKLRNPNMTRTLTLDYFEVLSHYIITTAFDKLNAQVCIFVPFPIWLRSYTFVEEDLRTHERDLRMALINPELAAGFEAARLLYSRNWAMLHVCDAPPCDHAGTLAGGGGGTGIDPTGRKPLEEAAARVVMASKVLTGSSTLTFTDKGLKDKVQPDASDALEVQRWGFRKLMERDHGTLWETLYKLALAGSAGSSSNFAGGTIIIPATPSIPMDTQILMLDQLVDATPPATLQVVDTGQPQESVKTLLGLEASAAADRNHGGMGAFIATMQAFDQMKCADVDDAGLVAGLIAFQKLLVAYKKSVGDVLGNAADVVGLREAQRQAMLDADADQVRSAFPLGDVAAAAERVDALIKHLNQHASHYRFAILQALPIGDQMRELALLGIPTELIEPRILGMINGGLSGADLLAVPINTALDPEWKKLREVFIDGNKDLVELTSDREVRMPTPGTSIEARLGACDACEDFIMQSRAIDLEQKRTQARAQAAAADQAEVETDRAKARVANGDLDDPTPTPTGLHVTIDKPVA